MLTTRRTKILAVAILAAFGLMFRPAPASAGTGWKLLRILKQTDAELVDAGGTSKVITLEGLTAAGGAPLEIEDVYVDMKTAFDRTTDGGPATMILDIGKSGAAAKFAKAVDMQATTDKIGSNTIDGGVTQGPRHVEASGLAVTLTVTSTTANISTNNAGEAHIYVKYGALPAR